MSDQKYSLEIVRQIWDDKAGDRIEVLPDRDGLDLVEIRYRTDDNRIGSTIAFMPKQARLVADALKACADELEGVNHE